MSSPDRNRPLESVCVAFKAHLGWVNAVAVAIESEDPRPVHAQRVDLLEREDRAVLEPYHVAGGWSGLERVPRPDNPSAIIRRARRAQDASAASTLKAFRSLLEQQGLMWSRAVVLTGRGRLGNDLERILESHAHIHVAEGEAIRDAARSALKEMNIGSANQDEKSILVEARGALDCEDCDGLMKGLRPPGAKSWAKEERLIALAAWLNRA